MILHVSAAATTFIDSKLCCGNKIWLNPNSFPSNNGVYCGFLFIIHHRTEAYYQFYTSSQRNHHNIYIIIIINLDWLLMSNNLFILLMKLPLHKITCIEMVWICTWGWSMNTKFKKNKKHYSLHFTCSDTDQAGLSKIVVHFLLSILLPESWTPGGEM